MRTSIRCYPDFILDKGRSLGFASARHDWTPISDSLSLRLRAGTISLFCSKCFSPFPHGTGSLSVSREYLALPDGPGGFTQDSSCPALLRIPLRFIRVHVRSCHALWRHFPEPSIPLTPCDGAVLLPRLCRNTAGLGYSPFARHYWGNHCCFLFLRVLRCFSSPRWPPSLMDVIPSG